MSHLMRKSILGGNAENFSSLEIFKFYLKSTSQIKAESHRGEKASEKSTRYEIFKHFSHFHLHFFFLSLLLLVLFFYFPYIKYHVNQNLFKRARESKSFAFKWI